MAQSTNALVYYEAAQSYVGWAALTANTDRDVFTSASKPWSNATGYEYIIAPAGVVTGGEVTSSGSNDEVSVAALTALMPWVSGADANGIISVNADATVSVPRGASAYTKSSITIDTSGAIAVVTGTTSAGALSNTRGAAGGPPFIAVGSIEIAQVWYTSASAGVVAASEIKQIVGDSLERYDYPVYTQDPAAGTVTFVEALPASHTGSVAKRVYLFYYTPQFSPLGKAADFVPANTTYSVNSTSYYGGAIGSSSSAIGQASFTWYPDNDGLTDAFIAKAGQEVWIKFKPDRNKTPYSLTQGIVGIAVTNPTTGPISASVTITPTQASSNYAS